MISVPQVVKNTVQYTGAILYCDNFLRGISILVCPKKLVVGRQKWYYKNLLSIVFEKYSDDSGYYLFKIRFG